MSSPRAIVLLLPPAIAVEELLLIEATGRTYNSSLLLAHLFSLLVPIGSRLCPHRECLVLRCFDSPDEDALLCNSY